MSIAIRVYADWSGLSEPLGLGWLHASEGAGRQVFDFEFDRAALANPATGNLQLDPRIGLFEGRQFPANDQPNFGVFADSSPDRWGRLLMQRRFERERRAGAIAASARLRESDYLLGVHDAFRSGALRFKLDDEGDFLDNRFPLAAPPFVRLRALEEASRALERDEDNTAPSGDEWLRMLIAPGGSLGGARPKASIVDPDGRLWIAKFPSLRDDHDVGAWEMVAQSLARAFGLRVPPAEVRAFASKRRTFLVKRFDRTSDGGRLHFASAMTLTGRSDGDDASTGASYLELADVLMRSGVQSDSDLVELWSRIVFNMLVSNSDDHLRNHGFILIPGSGWRLSDAFDMNPLQGATGLKLNVSESDNAIDLDLALSVAHYFRVSAADAREIVERGRSVVRQWRQIASALQISAAEQERLASAFHLAN